MIKQIKYTLIAFLIGSSLFAQERTKDTLDPEVVTVVKPYTPTVSDAFKIKETPTLDDATTTAKKDIKYNIFSIPVASTFTPAKGKAATVTKAKQEKLYDNYASLGVGNYTTILGEVYLNHELGRGETVGGYLSHHSSGGGIKDVLVEDGFWNTNLNVNYTKKERDYSWTVDGGGLYQKYNWYGLPEGLFDVTLADSLDVGHTYIGANIGGKIKFEDSYFKQASVRFKHFGDNLGSGENRFVVKGNVDVPIQDELISTRVTLDYLGGSFDQTFFTEDEIKYGNINFGIAPQYQLTQDDLTLNLGVNLVYLNDTEASKSKLYIYPNITASYRLVDELLIAYGGLEGGLIQNSYEGFAQENPFLSPTLFVSPTDQQYNVLAGIKGKLTNQISYNVNARYFAERSKALYKLNSFYGQATEDYQFGNSYNVIYDDVKTFSFSGELNVDVNRNFKLGAKAEFLSYNIKDEAEAWNLPNIKASLFTDYQIDENWFAGANLFYVGERKDQLSLSGIMTAIGDPSLYPSTVALDGYFDANAHVGYRITDQISAFAKVNNIANQDYQRWLNYKVQSIQFLVGATYQFDF
ncbi:MAG: TonB-dependent receptor [Aquaticitalea sp.]